MAGEIDVATRVREALVALLTNLPHTYEHVFSERVRALAEDELPALDVDTADENERVTSSFGPARTVECELLVKLKVTVREVDGFQTRIDEVFRAARVKIAEDNSLGGLCKYVHPVGKDEPERSNEGALPIVIQEQGYRVLYITPFNAPHTPL